jgi:DNA (cytosine-5)-methyltransferase 1
MILKRPLGVELFTGGGGLALGTSVAGFGHRLLVEYNRHACQSIHANISTLGGPELHEGDVRDVDFSSFEDTDLLAAGAPCQPFSIGGKHRAHRDERNLFPEVFRAIRQMLPRAVVIENVKGLLREGLTEFVEYIELQLAYPMVAPSEPADPEAWVSHLPRLRRARSREEGVEPSYRVTRVLLNAADFGVPQCRERVFFVALRHDVEADWSPPAPTHSRAALRLAQEVDGEYWRGHGLERKTTPNHALAGRWMRIAGKTKPWRTVRDALHGLPEPIAGAEREGWLNHVGQPGARSYPGHTGSPLDRPAKTLKAGVHGVPGGENMLQYANGKVRYFTVREAARLQTFPDSYAFSGAWGEAMRQIGNAVPVKLAEAVARSVRQCLERSAQVARSPVERSVERPGELLQGELALTAPQTA